MEKLKPNNRYLYYRVYFVVTVLVSNSVSLWCVFNKQPIKYFLYLAPVDIPSLIMLFNLMIFRWKYSLFGTNERTPFPEKPPLYKKTIFFGRISWFSFRGLPFFTIHIFDSGIGVYFIGGAKGYIPKEDIMSVDKQSFYGYRLIHKSPELRTPIMFSNREVFEKILTIIKQ